MPKDADRSPIILPPRSEITGESEQNPALRGPRPRRRRTGFLISLALVTLAIVVVVTGLYMHFGSITQPTQSKQGTIPPEQTGTFISAPYDTSQLNALTHLVDRMNYKELASLYVSHMSLDEKLGQMIITESEQNTYSDDLNYMITQLHVGGMIMYESHLQTASQARATTSLTQQNAKIPLLTSVDEEGGLYVNRLEHIYGARPGPTEISQTGSLVFDQQQGVKMAHDLLSIGLNTDLAPDVDVSIIPGYDTEDRTFGTTADEVIKYAGPYIEAMQSHGLIACLKHYPGGLGNTPYDAHDILPTDNRSLAQIYATELAPYKTFINSPNPFMRPAMIMSTDVLMPAVDPVLPTELSHKFMTDILRTQFGYDGVVITDALYMGGISDRWSEPEAAVLAIQAGNDMILSPMGSARTAAVIEALRQALQDGRLSIARVNEAVTRIIALKMQYHLLPATIPRD
ncbi:MAG TPA: glycoside hydrolase family 3 N-terminal domain-containing protein [Ktedonobacteraceae bacterium]|nr:glycoside hydrolase family 3 N-terminal domain-containing protein [Ktedonobacteraceae bacterium]